MPKRPRQARRESPAPADVTEDAESRNPAKVARRAPEQLVNQQDAASKNSYASGKARAVAQQAANLEAADLYRPKPEVAKEKKQALRKSPPSTTCAP